MNWRLAAEIALVLYLVWMLLFAWAAYTAPSGWGQARTSCTPGGGGRRRQ